MLERATEAVDRPGRDDVDLPGCRGPDQLIKARTLGAALGAADAIVRKLLDDAPATALDRRSQRLALVLDGLLSGRDAEIQTDALAVHMTLT